VCPLPGACMLRRFKLKSTTFVSDPKLEWLRAGDVFAGEIDAHRPGVVRLVHPTHPGVTCVLPIEAVEEVP
jgi:hypothetical protein